MRGLEIVVDLVILANLFMLGARRVNDLIRLVAVQGLLIASAPLVGALAAGQGVTARLVVVSLAAAVLKGALFPWFFARTARRVAIEREIDPALLGLAPSLLLGLGALLASLAVARELPFPAEWAASRIAAAASFATIAAGFLLVVARKKALVQVIGYLVLENGVYLFAAALAIEGPLWVELGVLLDLLAAVLVMGVAIHHIDRTFDSIDTTRLTSLSG